MKRKKDGNKGEQRNGIGIIAKLTKCELFTHALSFSSLCTVFFFSALRFIVQTFSTNKTLTTGFCISKNIHSTHQTPNTENCQKIRKTE